MTKHKTRVRKENGKWWVVKPAYGFGNSETTGPFRTHRDALRKAVSHPGPAHGMSVSPCPVPVADRGYYHNGWRPEIR